MGFSAEKIRIEKGATMTQPSVCRKKPFFFQPRLTIGSVNDMHEREADAVADNVMRMHDNESIQTKISPIDVQRKCSACNEEELAQRKEMQPNESEHSLENYIGNLDGGGKPLPDEVKNFYEPKFGYDFNSVRIHTDTVAAKSAQSINAAAYTSGNNIVFNEGQYTPETKAGKSLLAHELTHVVQQNSKNQVNKKDIKVQRSLSGYVTAMNQAPEPDYGEAAKHLNGEDPKTITFILDNNLKLATLTKSKLYEGGRDKPGVGPCSNICRMTEKYFLEVNPTATPFDYTVCDKKETEKAPEPENEEPAPEAPAPEKEPEVVDNENPSEMGACGFTQLYQECNDAVATCETVKDYCNKEYPGTTEKDELFNEFKKKADDKASDYPEASKNLNHFLAGSGANKEIPISLFENHSSLLDTLGVHRGMFIKGIKKRLKNGERGTIEMSYLSAANGFGYTDLGLSVGGYTVCSVVQVEVTETSSGEFSVEFKSWKIQVKDCYNWDPGKGVAFVGDDEDLCCIELFGRGKHFVTYTKVWDNTDGASKSNTTVSI